MACHAPGRAGGAASLRDALLYALLLLAAATQMAAASGRFELEVVEVQNPRSEVRSGQCCGGAERPSSNAQCPAQCRTVVVLCLKEYQSVAQEGSKGAPRP